MRYWNLVDFDLKELKAFNTSYDDLKEQPKAGKGKKSTVPVPVITPEDTADDVDGKSWYDSDDSGEHEYPFGATENEQEETAPVDESAVFNEIPEIIIEPKSKSRKKKK